MIFQSIVNFAYAVLIWFLSIFPSTTSQALSFINDPILAFRDIIIANGWWFPVDHLFILIQLTLAVWVVEIGIAITRFIAHSLTHGNVK